eukprot:6044151-Amphidinium_carterae.1
MCDKPIDYDRLNEFYATLDQPYGVPDDRLIPSQVRVDWSRWAHERTMNAGYNASDSHKWLLERDVDWKIAERGIPPHAPHQRFDSPDGLFPQNWPEPDDDPSEAHRDSHLIAALIMDDYDNQTPSDQVFANVPFAQTLDLRGRILEASVVYGLQPEQIDTALEHTQVREREVTAQANERFVHHALADLACRQRAQEVLLTVSPNDADFQVLKPRAFV